MTKLPRISSKKLISILLKLGFYFHHQTGSHIHLRHKTKEYLRVVIPINKETLAPKTLKTILKQAELTVEELRDIL
jgi:predicted RNA binding protein YcfA (HicA-like mRNA interferase family)